MSEKDKPYHHNNLKEELITTGIEMLHRDGIASFSLRKLSKEIGVSATACYNHFNNADELFGAMIKYITDRFANVLEIATRENPCGSITISMGCAYVKFFAEYPHYFSLLFDSQSLGIHITEDTIANDNSFAPFTVFETGAKLEMERLCIPKEELRNDLLIMWATAHGLAAMANMKGIRYEGDWVSLTETLMREKVNL